MAATLKCDTLQNSSSSVANITLDTSGNATVGGTIADSTAIIRPLINGGSWTYSSGTPASIDFTGIPSWVKRITIMIDGLSFAAAGAGVIRIGSGSLSTSGYTGSSAGVTTAPAVSNTSTTIGFSSLGTSTAAATITGLYILTQDGSNTWTCSGSHTRPADTSANLVFGWGYLSLGGALDRFSLVATTSTFDAGTVYYTYE